MNIRLIAVLGLSLSLYACGRGSVTANFRVYLPPAPPQEVAETARILEQRFGDYSSMFSSLKTSIDGNRIDFEFRGTSPAQKDLEYLANTQGVLRVVARDSPHIIWYSDRDIVSAECSRSSDNDYLNIRLTSAAGEKMLELTRRNVGKVLITTWDGQPLIDSTVQGVFGGSFQSSIPRDDQTAGFCVVIKHGRLPVPVEKSEYQAVS